MPWLQLQLTLRAEHAAQLESLLESLGAHSITLADSGDQPILEPGVGETPLWPCLRASALFDTDRDASALFDAARDVLGDALLAHSAETLHDRDWSREWLQHFEPVCCGERLWVCPSGIAPPAPDAVNLLLDPGLAFGTGTHETTRLCLNWLDAADLDDARVLDFGCGSGILGIAALLLGATHCSFVDNDPQALQASADNLERNGLQSADSLISHAADYPPGRAADFDIVLANILAGPLIELAPLLAASLRPGGAIVLSGLREEQAEAVQRAYASTIEFASPAVENGWLRLNGTRKHR